ncbi:MAG: hypothetical protein AABW64_00825 [Nanoarchaeota archaeon]
MGLFSKKPKQIPQQPLPAVPRFQQGQPYPRYENQVPPPPVRPEFPDLNHMPVEYIPEDEVPQPAFTIAQPRQQTQLLNRTPDIAQPQLDEIPQRQPAFMRPRYPQREAFANAAPEARDIPLTNPESAAPFRRSALQQPQAATIAQQPLPQMKRTEPMQQSATEDKPIFVKIGQYREAMSHIQVLKKNIQDVESLLGKLELIRTQEQEEITAAKNSLDAIKQRLLDIDKQLFDV